MWWFINGYWTTIRISGVQLYIGVTIENQNLPNIFKKSGGRILKGFIINKEIL